LETWLTPNDVIRICLFAMQRSRTKNEIWTWITRNVVNGVYLYLFSSLITCTTYLCSQWAPNVQIRCFMFDCSVKRLLVLNKGWKLYSHQIMIFLYVSSTCSVVERKTRYEPWITRNVVNGGNLFHPSYLITLTTYPCSQSAPNVQFKYVMFNWSIYILFVINRVWKRDSL
jgi:hypothetical protein